MDSGVKFGSLHGYSLHNAKRPPEQGQPLARFQSSGFGHEKAPNAAGGVASNADADQETSPNLPEPDFWLMEITVAGRGGRIRP